MFVIKQKFDVATSIYFDFMTSQGNDDFDRINY